MSCETYLKPCPFCGGELKLVNYYTAKATVGFGSIKCENCRVDIMAYGNSINELTDFVNKRAEQKALTINVKFTDEQMDEIIKKAKESFINEWQQD